MKKILFIFVLLAWLGAADAATRYVKTSCGNGITTFNPVTEACTGGSSTVYNSIANGLAATSAGDTLSIVAASYAVTIENGAIPNGTNANATTKIVGNLGAKWTLAPASCPNSYVIRFLNQRWIELGDVIVDAANCPGGIQLNDATTDNWFRDIETKNATTHAFTFDSGTPLTARNRVTRLNSHNNGTSNLHHCIYVTGVDNIVENSVLNDCSGHGIHLFAGSAGLNNRNIFRYNYIYANGSWGIGVYAGNDNQVYGNILVGNGITFAGTGGIRAGGGFSSDQADRTKVWNNTVSKHVLNTGYCLRVGSANSDTNEFKNNVCLDNTTNTVSDAGTGTVTTTNKLTTDDTLFVNTATNRYSPSAGSALLTDCGTNVGLSFNGSEPVCGALDPPRNTSAEVGLVDDNELYLTWTNNSRPPLIVTNACTVSSSTVSGTTLTGTNVSKHQLNTAVVFGGTPTITCGANAMTDSALIGNSLNAESLAFTAMTVTNNVGAPSASHVFTQSHYRCYSPALSPALAMIAKFALDTTCKVSQGGSVVVVGQTDCTAAACPSIGSKWQYNLNAAGLTNLTNTCGADNICFETSPPSGFIQQGHALDACLSGALTVVPGSVQLTADAVPTVTLAQDNCVPIGAMVKIGTGATPGAIYELLLENQTGEDFGGTNVPVRIEVVGVQAAL